MKIYIVTEGNYSDYHIECVFTDKAKAELFVKYHSISCFSDGHRIEEYETDDNYAPVDTYYCCSATFIFKNNFSTTNIDFSSDVELQGYQQELTDEKHNNINQYYEYDNSLYIVRYFREQDYKDKEYLLKSKMEKIGYDICSMIKNILAENYSYKDIQLLINKNVSE